jgi:hypothetical protein
MWLIIRLLFVLLVLMGWNVDEVQADLINLASLPGVGTRASSNWPDSVSHKRAIDGKMDTGWNAGTYTGWLEVNLKKPYQVETISLYDICWDGGQYHLYTNTYNLYVKSDTSDWMLIAHGTLYQSEDPDLYINVIDMPNPGSLIQFVKYEVIRDPHFTHPHWAHLQEMEIMGDSSQIPPVPLVPSVWLLGSGLVGCIWFRRLIRR